MEVVTHGLRTTAFKGKLTPQIYFKLKSPGLVGTCDCPVCPLLSWKPYCHTFLFCTTSPSVSSNSTDSQACRQSLHSLLACSCDTLLSKDERPATGVKNRRLTRDRIPSNFLISLYHVMHNLRLKTLLFKSISAMHVLNKQVNKNRKRKKKVQNSACYLDTNTISVPKHMKHIHTKKQPFFKNRTDFTKDITFKFHFTLVFQGRISLCSLG